MKNKKEHDKVDYLISVVTIIIIGFLIIVIAYLIFNDIYGWNCKIEASFDVDKYCLKETYSWGNLTTSISSMWVVRSHSQDARDAEAKKLAEEQLMLEYERQRMCYDSGYDINESYDIATDYNYNCLQLEYINDHFIDNVEQKDGGYIKGSYSGLFSSGYVEGRSYQYVVTSISATGKLVEHYQVHIDCAGNIHNEEVDFYEEAEFVMYYVNKCIGTN